MTVRSIRVLEHTDIAEIARRVGLDRLMDELIERLRAAFRDHEPELVRSMPRGGFEYRKPALGLVEWMPALEVGHRVAIKTVGYHPTNPVERRLPSVYANTTLYDTTTGRLIAICDATLLTAMRTGAASAVATDILAVDGPLTLGVIGCGAQSVSQIHAISRIRPIERVLAFDADADTASTLPDRLAAILSRVPVTILDAAAAVVASADVLCTVTSTDIGAGPVFEDAELKPWLHVNAVGADFPEKTEVPVALLRRAFVVPDYLAQCSVEGECQQLAGVDVGPELPDLVRSEERYRSERASLTVFDSTGWAVEDLVAADLAFAHAERLNIGHEVALHAEPNDPFDPYECVRAAQGDRRS